MRCAVLAMGAGLLGCTGPQLVCERREVLQEVQRVVEGRNIYNVVDENAVIEQPGPRPDTFRCRTTLFTVGYEPGGGRGPLRREALFYDVDVRGTRFTVQVAATEGRGPPLRVLPAATARDVP